ncbi:MAG: Vms1/Ankzf1 family peptidyl-tRNA hydrolase [Candidatus Nanohaloarchaea archaeon]
MKLPWKLREELEEKEEEVEELNAEIEELRQQKEKWEKKFEAEKQRRSKLSTEKQEAEEERNRLREKLQQTHSEEEKKDEDIDEEEEFRQLEFSEFIDGLNRLNSIESSDRDLVKVYCPGEIGDLSNLRELKNSVRKKQYSKIQGLESFIAFIDPVLGVFCFRLVPFFDEKVEVGMEFHVEDLMEFLDLEKHLCLVSAGETEIFREESGNYERVERINSRVDREHSKGGFSQGRFERKRDEQIEKHLDKVKEELEDYRNVYLLGEESLCEELPGEYLGGFDPTSRKPEQFYRVRFKTVF